VGFGLAETGVLSWVFIESRPPSSACGTTVELIKRLRHISKTCCNGPAHKASRPRAARSRTVKRKCSYPRSRRVKLAPRALGPARQVVQHPQDYQQEQAVAASVHRNRPPLAWERRFRFIMSLNERETADLLRAALQVAVVKCSERCLYQSAKWYGACCELRSGFLTLHQGCRAIDSDTNARYLYRAGGLADDRSSFGGPTPNCCDRQYRPR
jgi:hypothetical protein